jgi:hypothetical protein
MGDIGGRPDDCVFRVLSALGSSAAIGALLGAITATWTVRNPHARVARRLDTQQLTLRAPAQDVPKGLKGKAVPALLATTRGMGASGATLAAIGGVFAAVDVRALACRARGAEQP